MRSCHRASGATVTTNGRLIGGSRYFGAQEYLGSEHVKSRITFKGRQRGKAGARWRAARSHSVSFYKVLANHSRRHDPIQILAIGSSL